MDATLEGEFLDVPLQRKSMHLYYVRHSILEKLKAALPYFTGKVLDVGCGHMPYKSIITSSDKVSDYVGMDLADNRYYANKPDIYWNGSTIPLPNESVDTAIATEVLEHCPYPQQTLEEIHRVLKPGGVLFVTVPFVWILHETPCDEYRYTPFALRRLIETSKFEIIDLSALGGWNASLAQFVANWLYYSEANPLLRKIGKLMFFPVFKFLLKRDKIPTKFESRQMITGLSCLARRQDSR